MNFEGTTMNCLSKNKDGPDILLDYLAGTLDATTSAELERHAQKCADCRGLVGAWNTLEVAREVPEVSSGFDARLLAKVAAEPERSWGQRVVARGWRPMVPIAAGVGVLALALMIHVPDAGDADAVKTATVKQVQTDPEIEQVEQGLADLELLMPMSQGPADRK